MSINAENYTHGATGLRFEITRGRYLDYVRVPNGTRHQLLTSGLAELYMFEQLGMQKSRRGPTEYSDKFYLERRRREGLYYFELFLNTAAEKPYACGTADDIDVSGLIQRFAR